MSSLCSSALPLPLEGQYFSEEQMRMREPLLYEQYIGQYLTDEEVRARCSTAAVVFKRFALVWFCNYAVLNNFNS